MAREALARALSVVTRMPGRGLRMQEAASTRSPSTSTMQARQLPSGRYPGSGRWHRWGMAVPRRLATCQIVSPADASTSRPSRMKGTVSVMRCHSAKTPSEPGVS